MKHRLCQLFERHREVLLYLVFGVLTTAVNYIIYFVCRRLLPDGGWGVAASNTVAWALAVLFAFVTNRKFVFTSAAATPDEKRREFFSFVGARVFSLGLDQAVVLAGVVWLGYNELLVKLGSNVLVVVVNYFLSKFWIFRERG